MMGLAADIPDDRLWTRNDCQLLVCGTADVCQQGQYSKGWVGGSATADS